MKIFFGKRYREFKEKVRTVKGKVLISILVLAFALGLFVGFRYILAVLFISTLIFIMKDAEKENERVVSPWQHQARVEEIEKLEKKAKIIREHTKNHDDDLEAKLKLAELEEEIEALKKQYSTDDEKN